MDLVVGIAAVVIAVASACLGRGGPPRSQEELDEETAWIARTF